MGVDGQVVGTHSGMTSPPDPDLTASEQLDEDELGSDPVERAVEPPEGWVGADRFGTTPREEREGGRWTSGSPKRSPMSMATQERQ